MKVHALLFLSSMVLFPSEVAACKVTLDGEDKTSEYFVIDSANDEAYVDCLGQSKCRGAIITDCPIIKCFDSEACNSAEIINFTDSVICEGLHACHRTNITAANSASSSGKKQKVSCIGSASCDVAQISGETLEQVTCSGLKACRKVHIQGPKIVKCHDGHENTLACEGFATLETECLYCGKGGCADHINMCRYKIIGENQTDSDRYVKCEPEQLVGNCPAELKAELNLELKGEEGIDVDEEDGSRKTRGLRALKIE